MGATAGTGTATPSELEAKPDVKSEPATASGNPSNAADGDGAEQPAKRRRRPPAKHEGFCSSEAVTLGTDALEAVSVEEAAKGGSAEGKEKSQGQQVLSPSFLQFLRSFPAADSRLRCMTPDNTIPSAECTQQ